MMYFLIVQTGFLALTLDYIFQKVELQRLYLNNLFKYLPILWVYSINLGD